MMPSGMLANDGERMMECWQMMASGMLANGEWNVGE